MAESASTSSDSEGSASGESPRQEDTQEVRSNVLARNTACHQCRKRKMKCDGVRPVCANCVKPRARLAPGLQPPPCTWDDPNKVERRRKGHHDGANDAEDTTSRSTKKRAKLHQLEERVAAFEKLFQEQQKASSGSDTSRWVNGQTAATSVGVGGLPIQAANVGPQRPASIQDLAGPSLGPSPGESQGYNPNATFELAWPDWPRDLPCFEVVEHIVGVFFEKVPMLPRMFHKGRFMNHLHLPPSHVDFPAKALLHGILAITAPHIPESSLACREYFPLGTPASATIHPDRDFENQSADLRHLSLSLRGIDPGINIAADTNSARNRFQLWHRKKTMTNIAKHFENGSAIIQCLQAQILLVSVDQYNAWWIDSWMGSTACMRMAVPMGLHETTIVEGEPLKRWDHMVLPRATTPQEQAERDRTFWMAYTVERGSSLTTGWVTSLPHDEITVELPVEQVLWDRQAGGLRGQQSLQSPDFYSHHPPEHCDGFNFYIKAAILFDDSCKFFRAYCRGHHSIKKYLNHPTLRMLLSQINSFRLSTPQHLRRPTQALAGGNPQHAASQKIDTDMLAAIMLVNYTVMSLGEPLITKDSWNMDLAKMALSSVRANLSILYDINATSYDLTLLHLTSATIWMASCRCLCRFIEAATASGDQVSALIFRSECEVFRLALLRYGDRWPMADRVLKMIDAILAEQAASQNGSTLGGFDCRKDEIFDPEFEGSIRPSSQSRFKQQNRGTGSSPAGTTPGSTPSVAVSTSNSNAPSASAPPSYATNVTGGAERIGTTPIRTPEDILCPMSDGPTRGLGRLSQKNNANVIQKCPPPFAGDLPAPPQPQAHVPPQPQAPVPGQEAAWTMQNLPDWLSNYTFSSDSAPLYPTQTTQMGQDPPPPQHFQPPSTGLPAGIPPNPAPPAQGMGTIPNQNTGPELGVNLADWFDISNFAFDLEAMTRAAAQTNQAQGQAPSQAVSNAPALATAGTVEPNNLGMGQGWQFFDEQNSGGNDLLKLI